jgi:5-methylcytosine-specific restriction endonuclease McrA
MDTLVLANNYTPIGRCSWRKALRDVLKGRVEVLEEYEDKVVCAGRSVFQMPSVVRFLKNVRGFFKRRVKFNRANVWIRDNGQCQYCGCKIGKNDFTYDHVTPQSKGGKTCWENIVVACVPCNQRKQDKTVEQARMKLRSTPVMPKTLPSGDLSRIWGDMPDSWKMYVATVSYWHGDLSN